MRIGSHSSLPDDISAFPQPPPARSPKWARLLTITLVAIAILAGLGVPAFTAAALLAAMPLLLIGSFCCITIVTLISSLFYCRCCEVGSSWQIQRAFTRLPPTSPLYEDAPIHCTEQLFLKTHLTQTREDERTRDF